MRLIFLGSGEFGVPTLAHLCEQHEVCAVVSQPDKPAGRKRVLTPMPIAQFALDHNITLHRTDNANADAFVDTMKRYNADAAIVIAFGQKLSPALIGALAPAVMNLHSSLLPKYRGAAPINWAMIQGDNETGVSVIGLAQKMDAGLIYATRTTPIDPRETAGELHDRLALLGPGVIDEVLGHVASNTLKGETQNDSDATRAPKLSKADGWVDFTQSASSIRARIHGLTPWPGVTVTWRHGEGQSKEQPLKLCRVESMDADAPASAAPGSIFGDTHVACGQDSIRLLEVQTPGKRVMTIEEFTRGNTMNTGDQLISKTRSL